VNLLLDTHALLWWLDGGGRLGPRSVAAIGHPAAQVWVSAVSIWEISIKTAIGRLQFDLPPGKSIATVLEKGSRPLPITHRHAFAVGDLPLHHADPFDRMLIAQARCEDLTLVTADAAIAAYDVRTLDALR
jgi:PIN domain nuclease of toxin-antitoxin system